MTTWQVKRSLSGHYMIEPYTPSKVDFAKHGGWRWRETVFESESQDACTDYITKAIHADERRQARRRNFYLLVLGVVLVVVAIKLWG